VSPLLVFLFCSYPLFYSKDHTHKERKRIAYGGELKGLESTVKVVYSREEERGRIESFCSCSGSSTDRKRGGQLLFGYRPRVREEEGLELLLFLLL
jgi:hypothetical protein